MPTVEDDGDSDFDVLKFADGALERDKHELSELPAPAVAIIGTTAQVNAALATLVYTPDTDEDDDGTADDPYSYNGSNPESIDLLMAPGDPAMDTVSADIEIRVQKINEFPEVTVPDQVFQIPSGGTGYLGDAGDDVGQPDEEDWNVVDEDNDENDENDTLDGPGDEWLLISWADCGMFSMPASPFTVYDDLEQLFGDALDVGLEPDPVTEPDAYAEYQANKTAVIEAAMAALPDEVKNLPFATGNPSDPHSAFAGVVSGLNAIDSLNYALDNVEFQATGLADVTCTVRYLVSDLGNNGLPLQYLGDPPYGIQVPFFGFDLDTNDFPTTEKVVVEVGDGTMIEVALPSDVSVAEGGMNTVPLLVSPATHPAFDVTISTTAVPPTGPGDFTPINSVTFTVPADAPSIDIPVDALQDGDVDPGETYVVSIDGFPADPPFPPGFDVAITDGSATVTILDDEVPNTLLELSLPSDVAVAEGGMNTVPLLVSPATHPAFSVTVSTVVVPPTSAADFTPINSVTFPVPADAPSIDIPVDALFDGVADPGETYTVVLEGVVGSPPPGFDVAITDGSATVTILDVPNTLLELSLPSDVSVAEGGVNTVPLLVSPVTHPAFSVTVSTVVVPPTSAADFTPINSVTFPVPADAPAIDIPVDALQDIDLDPGETYTVMIEGILGSPPPGFDVAITDGSATVTILDDETEDTVAPSVTVEQGSGQADPTGVSPVVFEVVFSEPVTGFVNTDVVLSGSAGPTSAVVSGSGASYTVEVSGMSVDGLVVAEVAAGAAEDAAGNLSEASTSVDNEVTFEVLVGTDPLTITAPDDIVVDAPPGEPGVAVDFPAPTVSGGVAPIDVSCDFESGDVFPIGVTTVTCTAQDSAPEGEIVLFALVTDDFTITVNEGVGETPPTGEPTPPGGGPGGSGSGGSGSGSGTAGSGSGGIASTGVESGLTLTVAFALLLAGAAALRIGARRRGASARR
ncbi:HYR domain-containing protein [Agromyces sp. LHK192]|uniref:HYR domain-containing protein n=1 Tax=Agromyces sp. LHK192 TaxID=2498704 RepID=UPI000FD92248|nr:HYR domain-containing protein [Agromyces sp. LHK192]